MIAAIVDELAPALVMRNSIGHTGAAQLLLTAGGNPDRIRSEARFAALCGVSPVPASSGKIIRHRLTRGGVCAANSALHIIAIGRLRTGPRTKDYVARRIAKGQHVWARHAGAEPAPPRRTATWIRRHRRSPVHRPRTVVAPIVRAGTGGVMLASWTMDGFRTKIRCPASDTSHLGRPRSVTGKT